MQALLQITKNLFQLLLRGIDYLWQQARVLTLCGYPTTFLVLGCYFFLSNDQGVDFLRLLAERWAESRGGSLRNWLFIAGAAAWSGATWYCSRLLVTARYPGTDANNERNAWLRTVYPRVAGFAPPFAIALGFWLRAREGGKEDVADACSVLSWIFMVLSIVLLLIYVFRRDIFRRTFEVDAAGGKKALRASETSAGKLHRTSRRVLTVAFALSGILVAAFLISAVSVPRGLGAPAILLLAAASIILTGSIVLTYFPLTKGIHGLSLPVFLLAVVFSACNDNHEVRRIDGVTAGAPAARKTPEAYFNDWIEPRTPEARKDGPYPVFFVAAAGGGIRAAYWSAIVLGRAADRVGPAVWRNHLFAISGVSGGSLGAAVHVVQLRNATGQCMDPWERPCLAADAAEMLRQDFLSPVVSYLLFPDLIQRFLPFPFSIADRSRALELSWEKDSDRYLRGPQLSEPFLNLWSGERAEGLPILLLNSTRVETGQRAIVSNVRVAGFSDTIDLLAAQSRTGPGPDLVGLPLSAAVHLSARFTYVSPAGRVRDVGESKQPWGRLVDGGYFENSGAATASELLQRLAPSFSALCKQDRRIVPVLLLLRNDPKAPPLCSKASRAGRAPTRLLSEIASPLLALLNARGARGRLEEENARCHGWVEVEACGKARALEFSLSDDPSFTDPPLGWSLSMAAARSMRDQVAEHEKQFRCIESLIAGEESPDCSGAFEPVHATARTRT